ncbi:MAG: hypothetical protein J0H46_14600 [Bacteroidetes bacterium]|jgi:hypothetical protein|uniref:hypothetical protein n=1 Tax=uncultured Dysgonomonas sp. TaxID=206096 RepID=UPI001AC6991F|nr:hypothetical protein [uncultured Dysgonomonas sp.]MBN9484581.1 hypothetical protein [Bacteroidota bacterium]
MTSILIGALILSLLHAVIPNHWLPVIAIGKKEGWSLKEVSHVTLICALAHGSSTVLLGITLAFVGAKLDDSLSYFTNIVAPIILIAMGLIFIYRHHRHRHFNIDEAIRRKSSKAAIITALTVAMFFSPCMEIEAYFLLAGAEIAWLVWLLAILYLAIIIIGMLLMVSSAYKGLLKLNWHSLEHNAGIITGVTLVITGIITYFIK